MRKEINIEAILNKHEKLHPYHPNLSIREAIKEIVEATIDLCAEKAEASMKITRVFGPKKPVVDKESITNVKKLIKYE